MKRTSVGVDLLRRLAVNGLRIFTVHQAQEVARELKVNPGYVAESLHHLFKNGWITRLKRGVYAFNADSGFAEPPHEFEIAMALMESCAISHWTAMHYHHLTQQTPNKVFAITPAIVPRSLNRGMYHFTKIKKEHYFGIEKIWLGPAQINITDPERTLLDGLMEPEYCGDFQEVLHAFKMRGTDINLDRIIDYALKLDRAVVKRLGWILEKLGVEQSRIDALLQVPAKGYRKLDPTEPAKGPYNRKWMIQENIGIL